jgi:hypothetical protein
MRRAESTGIGRSSLKTLVFAGLLLGLAACNAESVAGPAGSDGQSRITPQNPPPTVGQPARPCILIPTAGCNRNFGA